MAVRPGNKRHPARRIPRIHWRDTFLFLRDMALVWDRPVGVVTLAARVVVVAVLVWLWIRALSTPMPTPYVSPFPLGNSNLIFHEAGHAIFRVFGRFIHAAGGTMGQLLVPFICAAVFLLKERNPFNAAVATWWFGENLLDIAPYMNDARARELLLLGGVTGKDVDGYHDWEYLLGRLGLLTWDHRLAGMCYTLGLTVMLASIAWAVYLLRQMWIDARSR